MDETMAESTDDKEFSLTFDVAILQEQLWITCAKCVTPVANLLAQVLEYQLSENICITINGLGHVSFENFYIVRWIQVGRSTFFYCILL